jgi:hypothetical protein
MCVYTSLQSIVVRAWRWMWPRDPFSVTARWGVRHRQVAAWIAAVAFIALVLYPSTRWGVLVTLWGILGAGLLVALILEEHAEPIQRRAWLRRNAHIVRPVVSQLIIHVGTVLTFAVGLSNEVSTAARFGKTLRERRQAVQRTRDLIGSYMSGGVPGNQQAHSDYPHWLRLLQNVQGFVNADVSANPPLMDRIPEVHAGINQLNMMGFLATSTHAPGTPQSDIEAFRRMQRGQVALICLDICDCCSQVLNEAGVLEN